MTVQKNTTEFDLFRNKIGVIKDRHFTIFGMEQKKIPLEEVVFIEVKTMRNLFLNKIFGFMALCLLTYDGLILHFSSLLSIVGIVLICLALLLKKQDYYLQLTFEAVKISFMKIDKTNKAEAEEFIKRFYQYKKLFHKH
jgi:hypothetical protein